ncbi:hypothetical protein EUTSA_v10017597mg, partial [Eutrema salsugineum]
MAKISEFPDDLLIKILSFLPTKVAVSTSVLSKQWQFIWMWLPKLKFTNDYSNPIMLRDFISKYLPLHRAPVIESLHLKCNCESTEPEDIKQWVGIAVSRCVRELSIYRSVFYNAVFLPSSLYTCKSLVTLELDGNILVNVPQMVLLPCLKTCKLQRVIYSNEDSLRMLLSHCPALEDLTISGIAGDNMGALVVNVPSLKRSSLYKGKTCSSSDRNVIVTPSLKYFQVEDYRENVSYLIEHMPNREEADICVWQDIDKFLESMTSVKSLTLRVLRPVYLPVVVFNQLEHLTLHISNNYWSKLLVRLLKVSPELRVLNLDVDV